ncbi:putative folate-biopterin transporter, major facilitator superfamily domain-containing protein [Rosa chinensis]|uniref:Putative folate-biopterin transporter, major facilitator superfamily domain-containing protein n=1 Tax=Rosa chinensis TaxID=74649 RepID=A0A2P6SPZ4_ROSCH|nr:probable folate-biopterin transporter 7 [Rosa chinensis]PRQ60751.1 putative folate-biopterin transporter, major facilitator superfamily domain-containing protein [Rosa chinensis]
MVLLTSSEAKIRKVLGLGYWVQGFRCFPWLAVNFFLKDGLQVDSSTLQLLQNSANLPMVGKPLYGLVSDAIYIAGQHRIPYLALGAFLQAVSWLAIAILSQSGISISAMTLYLLLSNLGASIAEVANDAIVAEAGKQPASSKNPQPSSSGELQSFVWMSSAVGGILGFLLGGIAIDRYAPQKMFLFYGFLLSVQFFISILVKESSMNLPKRRSDVGIREKLSELSIALRKPEIAYSITWFAASYAIIPSLTGTMFFYQTQYLNIDSSVLGISKVFGQAAMLLWSVIYNRHLKPVTPRKLISAIQVTMALFMISDALFANGFYRNMGLSDNFYIVIFSGLSEVLLFIKILPFSILVAKLCPPGCEGSLMAFVMSAIAVALIMSGYLGIALASYVGITGNDFSGLPLALLIQAFLTLLPLYWSSCIPILESEPDHVKAKPSSKKE